MLVTDTFIGQSCAVQAFNVIKVVWITEITVPLPKVPGSNL